MSIKIGDKVIKRRKELRMTQADLARNICTQSQVSRIEKSEIMPSSETLFKLANKLNVSMDYFFGVEKADNSIRGKKICQDYLEREDYMTLEVFVDAQLQTVLTAYEHRYFSWVKAVCLAYTSNALEEALLELKSLSEDKIIHYDPELEASIFNSLTIFYMRVEKYEEADRAIQKAKYIIKNANLYNDVTIKVYYQYAALLMKSGRYEECLETAQEGVNIALDHNIMYLFEYLVYLVCGAKQDLDMITTKDRELYKVGYSIAKLKNNADLQRNYENNLKTYYEHLEAI